MANDYTQSTEQPYQPVYNEDLVKQLIGSYHKAPQAFNDNLVKQIEEHSQFYGIAFDRNQDVEEVKLKNLVKQVGSGFVSGFSTFNVGDEPKNTWEGIAQSIGHLAGFVGYIPSAPLKMLGAKKLAQAAASLKGKSIPMIAAKEVTERVGKVTKEVVEQGVKSRSGVTKDVSNFLLKDTPKHITEGAFNTAVGYEALSGVTEGDANVGIGREAGKIISTGGTNVCVGNAAGQTITTGGQNICVGYAADVSASGSTYQFVIGYGITAAGDNDFAFGKSSNVVHNDFDADAAWSRTSDIRKKRNIKDDTLGLEFINKLKPVTHQWKPSNEFPEEWDEYSEENNMDLDVTIHNMIAQDVKQALDEVGCDTFGGWKEREDGSQSLSREMFITPLIKAVQELSAEVKSLKQQLEDK